MRNKTLKDKNSTPTHTNFLTLIYTKKSINVLYICINDAKEVFFFIQQFDKKYLIAVLIFFQFQCICLIFLKNIRGVIYLKTYICTLYFLSIQSIFQIKNILLQFTHTISNFISEYFTLHFDCFFCVNFYLIINPILYDIVLKYIISRNVIFL